MMIVVYVLVMIDDVGTAHGVNMGVVLKNL
jgi:hypothetical protein